jgi:hypothetical protein
MSALVRAKLIEFQYVNYLCLAVTMCIYICTNIDICTCKHPVILAVSMYVDE